MTPRLYRPLSPGPDERRALFVHALGMLLGLATLAFLWTRSDEAPLRGALLGAGAALVFAFVRSVNEFRRRTRRAQTMSLALGADALLFTDERGRETRIPWRGLKGDMKAGRLQLTWDGGELLIGSREWEDGMNLTRELATRLNPHRPTNFIPLESISRKGAKAQRKEEENP